MKKTLVSIVSILVVGILFNACKSSTTSPTNNNGDISSSYYPNNEGTSYKYNVNREDSTGSTTTGTRKSTYSGTVTLGGTVYQTQIDTLSFGGLTATSINYFRKTDAGVYLYLDTTGLSNVIPDSLIQYVSFSNELTEFSFPMGSGKSWDVAQMNLKYGALTINLIDVKAYYEGKESTTVNLDSGSKTFDAAKIKYVFVFSTPNPSNPLIVNKSTFNAYAWLVDNVGIVKWQGNGVILGAFAGGGINFSDTTSTVSQTLASYNIK